MIAITIVPFSDLSARRGTMRHRRLHVSTTGQNLGQEQDYLKSAFDASVDPTESGRARQTEARRRTTKLSGPARREQTPCFQKPPRRAGSAAAPGHASPPSKPSFGEKCAQRHTDSSASRLKPLFEFDLQLRNKLRFRIELNEQMDLISRIDFRFHRHSENHSITLSDNKPHWTDDFQVLTANAKRSRM